MTLKLNIYVVFQNHKNVKKKIKLSSVFTRCGSNDVFFTYDRKLFLRKTVEWA